MAELVIFRRNEELLRVTLDGSSSDPSRQRRWVLGRESGSVDVIVPAVSRRQLAVELRGADWFLVDLSGRGSDLGGKLVSEGALEDGIDIGLGAYRAVFNIAPLGVPDDAPTDLRRSGVTETAPASSGDESAATDPVVLTVEGPTGRSTQPFDGELSVGSATTGPLQIKDPRVSAPALPPGAHGEARPRHRPRLEVRHLRRRPPHLRQRGPLRDSDPHRGRRYCLERALQRRVESRSLCPCRLGFALCKPLLQCDALWFGPPPEAGGVAVVRRTWRGVRRPGRSCEHRAMAAMRGTSAKHGIKQVDQLLSNDSIDDDALDDGRLSFLLGGRTAIV